MEKNGASLHLLPSILVQLEGIERADELLGAAYSTGHRGRLKRGLPVVPIQPGRGDHRFEVALLKRHRFAGLLEHWSAWTLSLQMGGSKLCPKVGRWRTVRNRR